MQTRVACEAKENGLGRMCSTLLGMRRFPWWGSISYHIISYQVHYVPRHTRASLPHAALIYTYIYIYIIYIMSK